MTDPVKLVAFDMGGVMIRADESIPIAEFSRISGRSHDEVFSAIFSAEKKEPIETGRITPDDHARNSSEILGMEMDAGQFWRIHCTSHSPDPIVGSIVEATSEQIRIAIASNLPAPHWDWAKANLPYSDRFDPAVLSFDIGVMKPDARYFETLIQMSGLQPGQIFFTDDNVANVEAAAKLGIWAYLFENVEKLRSDLKASGIDV